MMEAINILKQTRKLFHVAVSGLSTEQYFTIPDRFDNNIAWNLGHVIAVQQRLHYKLTGVPAYLSEEQIAMFVPGTSPATWTQQPEIPLLLEQLLELPDKLEADYLAGKFTRFQPYTTSTGIVLNTFKEALTFNNYHEGIHFGFIAALRNLVG